MLTQASNKNADLAAALLIHYSFDLGSYSASELIDLWLKDFSARWVCSAVIESLYQGRYKAISVEQILAFWQRRGLALYHFNHEFERLVCGNLPQNLVGESDTTDSFSNEHDDSDVVTASSAEHNTAAKLVDFSNNVATTNSFGTELNRHSDQVSQSRRHSLPQSSPHSDSASPIKHFIPKTDDKGEFYTKLKAISESDREAPTPGEGTSP